jgi:hypothetical protein
VCRYYYRLVKKSTVGHSKYAKTLAPFIGDIDIQEQNVKTFQHALQMKLKKAERRKRKPIKEEKISNDQNVGNGTLFFFPGNFLPTHC